MSVGRAPHVYWIAVHVAMAGMRNSLRRRSCSTALADPRLSNRRQASVFPPSSLPSAGPRSISSELEPRRGFTGRVICWITIWGRRPGRRAPSGDGTGLHQFGVREIGLGEQDAFDACNPILER